MINSSSLYLARGREQPGLVVTDEGGKEAAPGFAPPQLDSAASNKEEVAPWRRPGSLRARPTNRWVCEITQNTLSKRKLTYILFRIFLWHFVWPLFGPSGCIYYNFCLKVWLLYVEIKRDNFHLPIFLIWVQMQKPRFRTANIRRISGEYSPSGINIRRISGEYSPSGIRGLA